MNSTETMSNFYNELDKLKVINSNLDNKREILSGFVSELKKELCNIALDDDMRKTNKDLSRMFDEIVSLSQDSIDDWEDKFKQMLAQEKFRSDLANHFIVMIFGRVKAGKSYLGNFIAKHRAKGQKAEFFRYDEAGQKEKINKLEELDEEEFKTNNLECTSSIQGFKLSGLAWIDTPGLGSMTAENGKLAKEYIQAADYVLYPSSSGAPFQRDEIEELGKIFDMNKKVTALITKSDTTIEDECECGSEDGCEKCDKGIIKILTNKTKAVRSGQEEWAKSEIAKILDKNKEQMLSEIFSLSAKTAEMAIENKDDIAFNDSNLPKLYEELTKIVKNKAIKLKQEAPYDGLKALVASILNDKEYSISNIQSKVKEFKEEMINIKKRLEILKSNCLSDVSSLVQSEVAKNSSSIDNGNLKIKLKQIDQDIQAQIGNIIEQNMKEVVRIYNNSLVNFTEGLGYEFNIEDKMQSVSLPTKKLNKVIWGSIFGAIATIGAGFATGGASFVIQGAAAALQLGAAAAAGLGASYIGSKIGESVSEDGTKNVKVGDNKEEVISNFMSSRINHYTNATNKIYAATQDRVFAPLENISADIEDKLVKFNEKLNKFLKEL
ncbi:dynamin family protein [Campylobacter concisus]|uniref:dynamin family protein n=1 Tax=Campylobacter concisus TaxID=199 RepID=UPI00122CBA7D|nr:dynamin family protein [Campylobacter concisus]